MCPRSEKRRREKKRSPRHPNPSSRWRQPPSEPPLRCSAKRATSAGRNRNTSRRWASCWLIRTPGSSRTKRAKPHRYLSRIPLAVTNKSVIHQQLVRLAEQWLRRNYRCGIVLSEQSCASGEMPDVIGWKGTCRSVLVECKVSRADFLADREKPFRKNPQLGIACDRLYLTPAGLIAADELPA